VCASWESLHHHQLEAREKDRIREGDTNSLYFFYPDKEGKKGGPGGGGYLSQKKARVLKPKKRQANTFTGERKWKLRGRTRRRREEGQLLMAQKLGRGKDEVHRKKKRGV